MILCIFFHSFFRFKSSNYQEGQKHLTISKHSLRFESKGNNLLQQAIVNIEGP